MKSKNITFISILLIILIIGSISVMAIYNKNNHIINESSVNVGTNRGEANKESSSSNERQTNDKLLRFNKDGNVEVVAIPEESSEQNQEYITIQVQLDTHSVNLDKFDFSKNVIFKTSDGVNLDKEIIWQKVEGGGHHYQGIYKIPKQINGKPIIQANTEYIELDINNLDIVVNRSFRWNKDVLGSIKI